MDAYEPEYQCCSCNDFGYLKVNEANVVAHCWCETGAKNHLENPAITQAVRNACNFTFAPIEATREPKNGDEFWDIAERWRKLVKASETYWARHAMEVKKALPYKDN